jgi:PAS domain S-box-containing protein
MMPDSNHPRASAVDPPAALSTERMQALLDYSWDILSLLDGDGKLLYNSPAAQRLHGFAPEEFDGRSTFDFIHPEDAPLVAEVFQRGLAQPGVPVRVRYRYAHKDGSWIWMEAVGVNMLDNPEVGAVVVNSRDITDRVEAENAVRESESHFRDLFTNMAQGFALCRLVFKDDVPDDFIYVEVNQSFTDQTGLTDVVGRRVSELIPGIRETDPDMLDRYGRVVRTGVPERFEVYRNALRLWFSISVYRPMPGHFASVFDVINDRKQAEEERLQLERQLSQSQKMDSLGNLAGGVAHDMNNVLGSILMLASAHEAIEPAGSPAQQAFATITKACQRGGDMVRRLLGLARQDISEAKLLDLNALVLEEVLLLERTTLAQVRFSLDLADRLRPVRGDDAALLHALMNLCVNALDAMPQGGTLTLRTRNAEPGWIELEVIDSGVGMPREVLDRAMDPFFTTKTHGKGTGLGLAIVYGTVKSHHGTMRLQSEPGRGTRVSVRLPSCEGEEYELPASPAPASEQAPQHLDVLLVDDDELIRAAIGPVLQAQGHRVVLARSGEEALDIMARGASPEVIILDMNMPGMGGRGVLPRIRSLRPEVPVLLATGRVGPEALALSREFSGVTLLPKPINARDLQAYLDTVRVGPR